MRAVGKIDIDRGLIIRNHTKKGDRIGILGLVQKGVDLYRVQRLLGHRDGRMTQRYAHLAPENLREAVQVFKDDYHKISTSSAVEPGSLDLTA